MDSHDRTHPVSEATVSNEGVERRTPVRKKSTYSSVNPLIINQLPEWVTVRGQANPKAYAVENARAGTAVIAGAALFALDQIVRADLSHFGAFRMRLALKGAVAASRLLRARADEADLRDTLYLARVGDEPGVAGRVHVILRRLAVGPLRRAEEEMVELRKLGDSSGLREIGFLLAEDIALATRLGWRQALPLHLMAIRDPALLQGEEGRWPRVGEAGWEERRHGVLARACIAAHAEAVTLARRAEALITTAETLRTRDSGAGLSLILSDDCVAPWRMAGDRAGFGQGGLGSDRAARRLCESLQAKGVLRLLTPRPTFRLYGL